MSSWKNPSVMSSWIKRLGLLLDKRLRGMFALVFVGLLFTRERRRTCTSWFRTAGISDEYESGYRAVGAVGRECKGLAMSMLFNVLESGVVAGQQRIKLAIDDTPSQRYGPCVEGAGIHHNPTPGPSDQTFLYGHSYVTLGLMVEHPSWGTISLPIRSEMYVRQKDLPKIPANRRPVFQTKLDQAAEQIKWAKTMLKSQQKPIWLVYDGGYAKKKAIQAAKQEGMVLVSRLRKDAALRSVPEPQSPGKRGRKPIYGREVISLAKRAGHRQGWQTEEMTLYGKKVEKQYKTFQATWKPAGGPIRVIIVKEDDGWVAFFCTELSATAAEILGMVADRNSLEQTFKDVKEVWGAGQQQVRNLHANIGASLDGKQALNLDSVALANRAVMLEWR
jgi:DDE superfamily endonuclease